MSFHNINLKKKIAKEICRPTKGEICKIAYTHIKTHYYTHCKKYLSNTSQWPVKISMAPPVLLYRITCMWLLAVLYCVTYTGNII